MTRTGSELFNKSTRRSPGTSPADSFKQAQVSPFSWGGCVFPPCLRISVWYSTPAAVHVIGGSSEIWLMPSGFFEKRPACCWRLTLCVVDVLTQMLDDFIWMGFIFHFLFFFLLESNTLTTHIYNWLLFQVHFLSTNDLLSCWCR